MSVAQEVVICNKAAVQGSQALRRGNGHLKLSLIDSVLSDSKDTDERPPGEFQIRLQLPHGLQTRDANKVSPQPSLKFH